MVLSALKKKSNRPPNLLAHHLATVLDGLTVGVIVVDTSGRIVVLNNWPPSSPGFPLRKQWVRCIWTFGRDRFRSGPRPFIP